MYVSSRHAAWVGAHAATAPPNRSDHRQVTVVMGAPATIPHKKKQPALYACPPRLRAKFHECLHPRLETLTARFLRKTHAKFAWDKFVEAVTRAIMITKTELLERDRRCRIHQKKQTRRMLAVLPVIEADRLTVEDNIAHADATSAARLGAAVARGIQATPTLYKRFDTRD